MVLAGRRLAGASLIDMRLSLEDAQQEITTDWIAAYRKYIGAP